MLFLIEILLAFALLGCTGATTTGPAPETSMRTTQVATAPAQLVTPAAEPVTPPAAPRGRVLRLHGSNTLGFSLAPAIARGFLASRGAADIRVNDESRERERIWVQGRVGDEWIHIEILAPGTKHGFGSLAKHACDLVMASRPIADDEIKSLAELGDLTAPGSETVVAMDGIAIVVHPNNPVSHLTTAQLADVFTQKITNWSELGGPSLPIVTYSRDANSGTHDTFATLVMNGQSIRAFKLFYDSAALVNAVMDAPGAIGFVGLPYVKQAKALAIEDGGAALLPTPFTISTEDYALARRLFFYAPSTPTEPLTRALVEFAVSDEGQKLVADAGFIPLSLRAEQAVAPKGAPPAYVKLTTGAVRLSTSLRFRTGGTEADAKALRDLDRLTRYLAWPENRGRKIVLAGFTDAMGTAATNDALAKQRAMTIAAHLQERGLEPAAVESFGSALPIASNDTLVGRARNRRVEIWLR